MKYAVIDVSSTGVSTVIAEGDKATGIFEAIYKDRINIAITEYFDGRKLTRRGIEKIIDALISSRANVKAMGADECYCISTAALRNVDNLEEIAEKVRMRTGIVINHLDGKTEAYCDFVSNRKYSAYDDAVLIDIGGGSVELCDFSKKSRSEMVCLDFGPLKLRNKYVADIYPTEDEAKRIKKYLRKKCDDEGLPKKGKFKTAVLVGTINDAIYAVYREYCENKKISPEFTYRGYKKFVDMLLTEHDRCFALIMKAAPEKINVLSVSALILKELLKRFKLDDIVISDCGVKEGYLTLVATGAENAVPVDLAAPPRFAPVEPQKPEKKKTKSKKSESEKSAKDEKSEKVVKSENGEKPEK